MAVSFSFENDTRLRAGFIGCGGHSYRNVFPVFAWAPVDLVAVCDRDEDRSEAFRRQFGALRTYTDYRTMLDAEELDCVFVVTGYDESGRITHADIAVDCLRRGVSTWVEKPPVNSLDDVAAIRAAMAEGGAQYAVGFKKAFMPANRKLRDLTMADDFGEVRAIALRYSQDVPAPDETSAWKRTMFFDHIGHPLSLLYFLGGRAASLFYRRSHNGFAFATFEMASGVTAGLQLVPSTSQRVIAERTEVNGDLATGIVENNTRVVLARNPGFVDVAGWGKGKKMWHTYGRDADFTGEPTDGYLVWEPEFSLGQLYNKGIFLLGYYDEVTAFCRAVLDKRPVAVGGIDYAEEGIRLYEAFRKGPGRIIDLDD